MDCKEGGVCGSTLPNPIEPGLMIRCSYKIRRVCRSTLAAEGQSACMAVEGPDWVKVLLEEAINPEFRLSQYGTALQRRRGALIMDAKSVFDSVNRDGNRLPQDGRLAIDLRLLALYITNSSCDVKSVCGPQQLADCLTKYLPPDTMDRLLELSGLRYQSRL